jgi:type VI secretion system ImpC/EvpB family protein/type VI secretion system ImpB/VipA family protein
MAGETKGFMGGGMQFGTGDDDLPAEQGPLLPLRMLVVADLVPRGENNAGASPPEGATKIDPTRFDDLFQRLRPRVSIEVPSVLAEGRPQRVEMAITSLKSFRPDGMLTEVPLLRALFDGRLVLERLRDGSLTVEAAQVELNRLWNSSPFAREVLGLLPVKQAAAAPVASAPAPVVDSSGALDDLLSMVDVSAPPAPVATPYEPPPPPVAAEGLQSKLGALIAQVVKSGRGSGVKPTEAIARVEKAIGLQIGAILQHPEVRRLEQSYRGLKLLADRASGHTGARIEVVSARAEDADNVLARAIRTNAAGEPPVTCAVVDVTIDGSAVGFARLEAIAHVAEAYAVPTIVNGNARLLGLDDLAEVERLDHKGGLYTRPERAPWRSTAEKPMLRWVTIAMNGVLSRAAYDKTTSRVREAVIRELPDDATGMVWIPAAYPVATLILASFKETGWPCRIVGPRAGTVENLPVRELKDGYEGTEGVAIPTEVFVSTDSQRELSKVGVLLLAAAPNSDAVYVLSAPTAYVTPPKKTYDSASTAPEVRLDRVSLVDQLFVARVSQFLRALCSKLPPNSPPADIGPIIEAALWQLFEGAPPASIELSAKAKSESGNTFVDVTLRPRRFLGVAIEEIGMEVPLG